MKRTEDGRHIVAAGRRWRASDPLLPEDARRRLVSHLMSARRAVAAARRTADPAAERAARDRVHLAKTGLGERGTPWWEQSPEARRERWESALHALDADGADG
ncbi:hypothetical protein [Nocardiopsis composta]|uniref:Biopolymer transporter Tol n=1 Tax=Nocardiopsis composta TaxID=157465 RepID=A0A7W8VF04_9ACTN|nr:hypothetical protein [Nocardiopsis composta]MBB5433887.1 hypothetical protein [Nocardiopsis composta]